jgi:hypothetical protein
MAGFDLELLLRDVKGIEIEWMEQYSNKPRIILLTDEDNCFPYFQGVQEKWGDLQPLRKVNPKQAFLLRTSYGLGEIL